MRKSGRKFNQRGFGVIELLLVFVVVGLLVVAGRFVWQRQHSQNSSNSSKTSDAIQTTTDTTSDIAEFRKFAAETAQSQYAGAITTKDNQVFYFNFPADNDKVSYNLANPDKAIVLTDTIGTSDKQNSKKVQEYFKKLIDELKSRGINSGKTKDGPSQGDLPSTVFSFDWGSYKCNLSLTYNAADTSLIDGSCNPSRDYVALDKALKPFVEAVMAKDSTSDITFTASLPLDNIGTDSQTPGYQYWEINVSQAASYYFYRKTDGNWIFYKYFKDMPSCSKDFPSNGEVYLAFKGIECYGANGISKL